MVSGSGKRVLFVAYYFPPRGGAGVQRSLKFVKYLRRFGWEPTVLTDDYSKRSGAFDDTLLSEIPGDTRIVRIPSSEDFFVALSRIGLGRLAGVLLRPDTQVTWVKKALTVARELHEREPFDAVYTSVQPWSMGLVGLRLKSELGIPWVCDFRDPWASSVHLVWPSRSYWEKDRDLEGRFIESADRTLVVTPTMRDEFLAAHPSVSPHKVQVLYNGYDTDDLNAVPNGGDGRFTIVFTGKFQYDCGHERPNAWQRLRRIGSYAARDVVLDTHSPAYFLRGLAEFLARFADRRAKTRVVFAGTILPGNREIVNQLALADVVETRGYLPHGESVALARAADALLLPMFSTPNPTERVAYASGKVFEYMAARRPILALVQEGDAKDLALESGLGVVVAPRDVSAISRAIEMLYDNWAAGGGRFRPNEEFIRSFTRESLTRQLAKTLDAITADAGGAW